MKGLNFVPSTIMDLFQTLRDVKKFIQDLTVKKHFFFEEVNGVVPTTNKQNINDLNHKGVNVFPLQAHFSDQLAIKTLIE